MSQNTTATARLFTGFAVMIALLIVVVTLGFQALDKQIDLLSSNRLLQVTVVGQWEASVLRTARHVQAALTASFEGGSEVNAELKAIKANENEQAALHAQMEGLVDTEQGKMLLLGIHQAYKPLLAMEQLTSIVVRNAQNARQANELAVTACDTAHKGSERGRGRSGRHYGSNIRCI